MTSLLEGLVVLSVIVAAIAVGETIRYIITRGRDRPTLPDDPTEAEIRTYVRDVSEKGFGTRDIEEANRRADVLIEWREEQ